MFQLSNDPSGPEAGDRLSEPSVGGVQDRSPPSTLNSVHSGEHGAPGLCQSG